MKRISSFIMLMLLVAGNLFGQLSSLKGKVTDNKGTPLAGVSVSIRGKDASKIVLTNEQGEFELQSPSTAREIVFTYTGMKSVQLPVNGRSSFNIVMSPEDKDLEEVVVTALGIRRETRALSYSQQGVDLGNLNETKSTNLLNQLSGKIAGLQIVPSNYNTGSTRMVIRGNSSLTGNNQPLIVIDGMPFDNDPGEANGIDYGSNAADLNSEDIENIQVLKGPNASALYGSRAANGVILVTTKKGKNKLSVQVNSGTMFQTLTELPEYQNAYGVGTSFYIDRTNTIPKAIVNYRSWGSPMLGQPYVALNGEVKPYMPQPDNVKDFYQTGKLMTNSVSVEGGNNATTYRLSYTNSVGSSVVDGFNENAKHNINLRLQTKFSDRFSFDTKINYIRDIVDNRQYSNANGRNPTNLYTHMARTTDLAELMPYKDPLTGKEIGTHRNFSNPYWVINENPNKDIRDRLIASVNPEFTILPWLKVIGRAGADMYWWDGFEFNNIGSIVASNPNGFMWKFH